MVRGFVIFHFYITISQVVRGGVQVNRDEVIEEKGPLFEVYYHSILLSLCVHLTKIFNMHGQYAYNLNIQLSLTLSLEPIIVEKGN